MTPHNESTGLLGDIALERCRRLATRIDTGSGDDAQERALTVFHIGDSDSPAVAGAVTFSVAMPWRENRALPPVWIRHFASGSDCPVSIVGQRFTPPLAESDIYGTLQFELRWVAFPILPGGWDTYIASYSVDAPPQQSDDASLAAEAERSLYLVVESLRRLGDLPPRRPAAVGLD